MTLLTRPEVLSLAQKAGIHLPRRKQFTLSDLKPLGLRRVLVERYEPDPRKDGK